MKRSIVLHYNIALIILVVLSASALAQQRPVSGIVLENLTNTPLDGATISVKNNKGSAITKADGRFEIKVPQGKVVLNITFVGYQAKTVTLADKRGECRGKIKSFIQQSVE